MALRNVNDAFFYSRADVKYYDDTVDLAAPQYRLMHDMLVELVETYLNTFRGPCVDILDIGSGTGVTTKSLLSHFPNIRVVALDFSAAANEALRSKLRPCFGNEDPEGRWQIANLDIVAAAKAGQDLRSWCRRECRADGFAAVVSSLTLHHFKAEQKRAVYKAAHRCLASDGLLINADFFDFAGVDSKDGRTYPHLLSQKAQAVTVDWIQQGFDHPPSAHSGTALDHSTRQRLKRQWIKHVSVDHHLDSIDEHFKWLARLRFYDLFCPFRFWQSAVLWARRGAKGRRP